MLPVSPKEAERLASEYLPLVDKIVGSFKRSTPNYIHDDLRSAGLNALLKAITKFDQEKGLNTGFVYSCVRNAVMDTIRSTYRYSKIVTSVDDFESERSETDITQQRPLDDFVDVIRRMELVLLLLRNERTRRIFEMRFKGHTYKDISAELGLSTPSISRAISSGKREVMQALEAEKDAA